jgi:hypothetical protein
MKLNCQTKAAQNKNKKFEFETVHLKTLSEPTMMSVYSQTRNNSLNISKNFKFPNTQLVFFALLGIFGTIPKWICSKIQALLKLNKRKPQDFISRDRHKYSSFFDKVFCSFNQRRKIS